MDIIDLLVNELDVEQLNEVQLMSLASRLLDIAVNKIAEKENDCYE